MLICIITGLIGLFSWPYLAMWERSIVIDSELARLPDHDWAGHYVGQCWDLSLAPKSGFALERLPPFYHDATPDYGSVEQHGDEIQLNSRGSHSRFHIVRWGKRRYLIQVATSYNPKRFSHSASIYERTEKVPASRARSQTVGTCCESVTNRYRSAETRKCRLPTGDFSTRRW